MAAAPTFEAPRSRSRPWGHSACVSIAFRFYATCTDRQTLKHQVSKLAAFVYVTFLLFVTVARLINQQLPPASEKGLGGTTTSQAKSSRKNHKTAKESNLSACRNCHGRSKHPFAFVNLGSCRDTHGPRLLSPRRRLAHHHHSSAIYLRVCWRSLPRMPPAVMVSGRHSNKAVVQLERTSQFGTYRVSRQLVGWAIRLEGRIPGPRVEPSKERCVAQRCDDHGRGRHTLHG